MYRYAVPIQGGLAIILVVYTGIKLSSVWTYDFITGKRELNSSSFRSQFNSYIDQVHLERNSNEEGTVRHMSANACLTPVVSLHGMAVTTVEGIGSTK